VLMYTEYCVLYSTGCKKPIELLEGNYPFFLLYCPFYSTEF
jgi:hypothetical protein